MTLDVPDFEQIQTERAKRRLREYVKQAWPLVEPATVFVPSFHTDAVCDHLEAVINRQIRHLVINIPPRHSKSLLACVFAPTWAWIDPFHGRDKERPAAPFRGPNVRFLCASYAQTLATRDSRKSRILLNSPWFQERWGDHFKFTTDQDEKQRYENDKTGYRIATSVGGTVTGEGGDCLIIDDPTKADEAESDTVRQGVNDWFDQAWSTRLNDPNTSAMVVIMQRLHELDLTGHLMDKGGWEFLILPTEYTRSVYVRASGFRVDPATHATSIGFRDPRTEEGQLLNPVRFGPDAVAQAKLDLGAYGFAGQHSQRPSPAEGGRIKRVWFRYWHRPGTNPGPVPVRTAADGLIMVPSVELPTASAEELAKNPQAPWDEMLQSWDCLDGETEILTRDGWAGRGGIKEGDTVYALNRATGKLEVVPVLRYGERVVSSGEKFLRIYSNRVNLRVTEGHNMYVGIPKGGSPSAPYYRLEWKTITARQLAEARRTYRLLVSAEASFPGVDLSDDQLRLIAWFITDGGFSNRYIQITQSKNYREEIRDLLRRLRLDFIERIRQVDPRYGYGNSKPAHLFLVPKGTKTGKYKRSGWIGLAPWFDKEIAPGLEQMTRAQFAVFWLELMKGDGDFTNGYLCCGRRRNLAERLQRMAVTRGYSSSIHSRPSQSGRMMWYVCARDRQSVQSNPKIANAAKVVMEEAVPGERVWCVENQYGTLVTRRGGRVAILGNCSFKDKERRGHAGDLDYVAGGVWVRKSADKFILDLAHDRMDFPTTLAAARHMCAKWPQIYAKLVEDKANGSAVIDSLQHEIGGFIAVEPMGGKPARVAAASPQIESGNVYLPHPAQCPWTEKVILECITFPNAAHDDLVDMLTQALIRMEHAKVQVYAFDSAGKMITSDERTLTPDQRFLRGLSPTDSIPEPSNDKPANPRDTMTPEQRYELGLE